MIWFLKLQMMFASLLGFMLAAEGDDNDTNDDDDDDGNDDGADAKTFTQAEVDAMIARRLKSTKKKAAAELADELGVPVSEAKTMIAEMREADKEKMSAAEKAKADAETAKAEANKAKAAAAADRLAAKVERQLSRAGLDDKLIDDFAPNILGNLPDDPDSDDIKEAIEEFKTKAPSLFDETSENPRPGYDPKRKNKERNRSQQKSGIAAGLAIAEKHAERYSKSA